MTISAYTKDRDIRNKDRARQLARLALAADASAGSLGIIQVQLVSGYDIGIASYWDRQTYSGTPSQWAAD